MLTEDFSPWLIEINSCPCMSPTTSVTARMCGQCLEDVIKGIRFNIFHLFNKINYCREQLLAALMIKHWLGF